MTAGLIAKDTLNSRTSYRIRMNTGRNHGSFIGLLLVAFVLVVGSARAADEKTSPVAEASSKKKIIRFEGVTIAGEAKKPQVYYLLNRKKIQIGHQPVDWNLLEGIPESLEEKPF
jgi:hypothetical protein